ncbi:Gfo/Idh/MocA family oxidoreductase [Neolewinella aurantiaca]|uniref:Gfo/Idh/MocA family oxidoreductase n=1 Tax=Neolewinella aurantiaca TaxID=2602767 RepID=A0A5C7FRV7_9BACT|nr:Gfo/Idh/MocA family oxidoreductase [Neolewinella aurantiaca]TXF88876.1 Gfo/Idh/MocA family oxidoreductase [Neolewinella aurantiaca]
MQRRQFLASVPALLLSPATLHPRPRPKVALIGCGWYGKSDLLRLIQVADTDVVGLCDVDANMLEEARSLLYERQPHHQPGLYRKHEDLLARAKPDIVLIATPDHWHALQAVDALKAGCHLYLQKPIGVDVGECEAILAAARRHKRVVQVGLQRRSTPHLLEMKDRYIDSGLLGEVHHVEMHCYYHMRDRSVREVVSVPDHFDYEQWTGPAPLLPFKGLPHRRWRAFREYGNGIVGDMCVHYFDAVRWLLGLGWPTRVSSLGGVFVQTDADATITDTQTAVFEYPEQKLNCHWTHRSWGQAPDADWPWAFTLYGTGGTLRASTHRYEWKPNKGEAIVAEATYEREKFPEDTTEKGIEIHVAPATRAHMTDFLAAIENNQKPAADIEDGYISTVACIMANMACELGRPLTYDPRKKVVTDDEEATTLLERKYRKGYTRP